jgi:hypothetical protein
MFPYSPSRFKLKRLKSCAFLTPASGMEKNPDPGYGMNMPDLIFENLASVFGLKILKFFDADLGSCQPWIRDD